MIMENNKPRIPFPQIGKKVEKVEEQKVSKVEEEFKEQIKEQEQSQEDFFNANYSMVCNHKISLGAFVKTQLKVCGICKKYMFVEHSKGGNWMELDKELPEEWLTL